MKYAVWRQVVVHGLDPYAGYLHVDRSGRPRVGPEEFRPHVDLLVLRLKPDGGWVEGGLLTREVRAQIVQRWAELKLEPVIARQVAAVAHLEGRALYAPRSL